MKKLVVFFVAIFGMSSNVYAESFLCSGNGDFRAIQNAEVTLTWKTEPQKVLLENNKMTVQVSIDKSNGNGDHYFAIEVISKGDDGLLVMGGAKGSINAMVQYVSKAPSMITCVPIGK